MRIVSGDKHLLQVSGFQDLQLLNPREFVDEYLIAGGKKYTVLVVGYVIFNLLR